MTVSPSEKEAGKGEFRNDTGTKNENTAGGKYTSMTED